MGERKWSTPEAVAFRLAALELSAADTQRRLPWARLRRFQRLRCPLS
jgi:hypothetical protein